MPEQPDNPMHSYVGGLVAAAFVDENRARHEHRDPTALSVSGVGSCTRKAAYAIAGVDASDVPPPEEARQAMLGTWIHDHLLPRMAAAAGPAAIYERAVTVRAAGLTIPGTLDFAVLDLPGLPAPHRIVLDLKSVAQWGLQGVHRLGGAYTAHIIQVLTYILGLVQTTGATVDQGVFLYLDRSSGAVTVHDTPWTNRALQVVVDRVADLTRWAETPDLAPREVATITRAGVGREYALMRGPGLSFTCDRCPWLRRCWGPTATPKEKGAQSSLAATPAGIIQALQLYEAGQLACSPGEKDKEFGKLVLADVPDGTYGGYKLKRDRPGRMLDQAAVRARYAQLGEPVPEFETAGKIRVTRVPGVAKSRDV
jgi:hypothetical protein